MQIAATLILEAYVEGDNIKISAYTKEATEITIRQYSESRISYHQIETLSKEVFDLLSKTNRQGSLSADLLQELKKTSQALYDRLLPKSAKDRLRSAIEENLILSLDERLVFIPWELLFDGSDFFCLRFNLGRSVRTRQEVSGLRYRSSMQRLKMLVLADPTGDLPSAHKEGVGILNAVDRKRHLIHADLKSNDIDTSFVEKHIRDYDIIHYAGHAHYDSSSPRDSGWVLKDADFTIKDILRLGGSGEMPAIIFANACESAKSDVQFDSQGNIYNLANAFLLSGVRHYIGTFYKISDNLGSVFSKEFYTHIILGKSVGESLRHARRKVIQEFSPSQITWAGYVLYGDPTFIPFKQRSLNSLLKSAKKSRHLTRRIALGLGVASLMIIAGVAINNLKFTINPSSKLLMAHADKYFKNGENEKAIAIFNDVIKRDPKEHNAYLKLADAYYRLGNWDLALKYYFDLCRFSEEKHDFNNLAFGYIKIGWVYYNLYNYSSAFEFYNKALQLSQRTSNKLMEADALGRLALWYRDKTGDYKKALSLLYKSTEINRSRQHIYQHKYNLACDYFNIALLFSDNDEFNTAREFYDKSLKLFKELNCEADLNDYYCNIGEMYKFEKKYQKALEYYAKSIDIDVKLNNRPGVACTYSIVGELYTETKDFDKALEYFSKAFSIYNDIDNKPGKADTYYYLALLHKDWDKIDRSREYALSSLELYRFIDTDMYNGKKKEFKELGILE